MHPVTVNWPEADAVNLFICCSSKHSADRLTGIQSAWNWAFTVILSSPRAARSLPSLFFSWQQRERAREAAIKWAFLEARSRPQRLRWFWQSHKSACTTGRQAELSLCSPGDRTGPDRRRGQEPAPVTQFFMIFSSLFESSVLRRQAVVLTKAA